jgi:hypothetical protein
MEEIIPICHGDKAVMGKGLQWNDADDVALCIAYTNISEDGAISCDQQRDAFWERITQAYSMKAERENLSMRNTTSLQSRWAQSIQKDVQLFISLLNIVPTTLNLCIEDFNERFFRSRVRITADGAKNKLKEKPCCDFGYVGRTRTASYLSSTANV